MGKTGVAFVRGSARRTGLRNGNTSFEDLIGGYYMETALSQKGQQWNGEFHTPKNVCDMMARILMGDTGSWPAEGPITVCEPACGAGAMILSCAQACPPEIRSRLRFTAIDISRTACDMAFINTTLWASPPGSCTAMRCRMSIGPHGQISIISRRGCRSHFASNRPKRWNKANRPSLPKCNASKFRLDSRNCHLADISTTPHNKL